MMLDIHLQKKYEVSVVNFKKQSTYGKYWVERSRIRDTVWKNLEVITQITEVGQTE